MTTIIRTPDLIADATTEVLLASYNALTGESVKRFSSRAAAERRTEMAMLTAQDRTAHAGVPKGTTKIIPKTAKELGYKPPEEDAEPIAQAFPGVLEDGHEAEPVAARPCPADWSKMCADLACGCVKAEDPKTKSGRTRRPKLEWAKATGSGFTKLQPKSERAAVMAEINTYPHQLAPIEALDADFNGKARGHIQKLLATGHIAILTQAEADAIIKSEAA